MNKIVVFFPHSNLRLHGISRAYHTFIAGFESKISDQRRLEDVLTTYKKYISWRFQWEMPINGFFFGRNPTEPPKTAATQP